MTTRLTNILDTSAALFRKKGYKATTLVDIAGAVGIEAPSLYNHILSKQDILKQLLLPIGEAFVHRGKSVIKGDSDAYTKLNELINIHIELTFTYTDTMSLLIAEYVHLSDEDKAQFVKLRQTYDEIFRSVLHDAMDVGQVSKMDVDFTTFCILSTLRSLYAWVGKHKMSDHEQVATHVKSYIFNGILTNNTL